jgi:thiamine-phosphate pyrophosphorylase
MSTQGRLKGLYVISDDTLTPKHKLLDSMQQALEGGASIVQLRDKQSSDEELEPLILKLQALCEQYNALFVLNDRVELAIKLQTHGLHIGKSDYHRIEYIRENFKHILGISCYGDVSLALNMQKKGVNYVAFGSFFTSPTKPHSAVVPFEVIGEAKNKLRIPVCVIGGINLHNLDEVLEYKPDMVAVIHDIFKQETHIQQQVKNYIQRMQQ